MIHFGQLEKDYREYNTEWLELVKDAKSIKFWNGEGALLKLINTWKIEDWIQNLLSTFPYYKSVEHTDPNWDYYYPELEKDNGPDLKVKTNSSEYYIEVKHVYGTEDFYKTYKGYSTYYKEGKLTIKYIDDYRFKGYNTAFVAIVGVIDDELHVMMVNTYTGYSISLGSFPNNLNLVPIEQNKHR